MAAPRLGKQVSSKTEARIMQAQGGSQAQVGNRQAPAEAAGFGAVHESAPTFRTPPHAALDVLHQFGCRRTVRRGHELYTAGDPVESCYRIMGGSVRTFELDEEGRRHITDFLLAGDLLGSDCVGTHHLSAEAVTDAELVRYPRRAVDLLAAQHGGVARHLHDLAAQSLRRAHGRMFLLGRATAGERLAAFLLEMSARAPERASGAVELPMTRTDIADHLGLATETASRNMTQLCRLGVIAATKSGIRIRDRQALAAFGLEARH